MGAVLYRSLPSSGDSSNAVYAVTQPVLRYKEVQKSLVISAGVGVVIETECKSERTHHLMSYMDTPCYPLCI